VGATVAVYIQSEIIRLQWKKSDSDPPKGSGFFDLVSNAISKFVFARNTIIGVDNDDKTIIETESHIVENSLSALAPSSPIIVYRPNSHLEIAFDTRSKNPVYVLERLLPRSQRLLNENTVTRDGINFYEEKSLPEIHRSRNGYYRHSGYDRGHHAPAADFTMSEKHMRDTFSLCNISPQTPVLNRKIWSRLEALVRQLVDETEESNTKELLSSYVITGPLWLPARMLPSSPSGEKSTFQYSFLGLGTPPSLLQVPTHFFKVVATMSHDKETNKPTHVRKIAAFVIPNSNFDHMDSINLQDFSVKISDLEAVSGMLFFPNIWNGNKVISTADDSVRETNSEKKLIDLTTEKLNIDISSQRRIPMGSADVNGLVPMTSSTTDIAKLSKELRALSKHIAKSGVPLPDHYCQKSACNIVVRLS
jgi:DNA/RNA endonuclease G (NUC1)